MKISLIIPSFYPATIYGGPIFSTLHTCTELAKLNDVEIYVSTTNANMTTRLDVKVNEWIKFENNLYVKYYNEIKINRLSLQLIFNIWKDIKKADIVHIQSIFSSSTPISLFFARLFKKPIILSPRGQFGSWCLDNGSSLKQKWLNLFVKPFANSIVWHATAEQEKREIQVLYPFAKVAVIPNGIEYDDFQLANYMSSIEFSRKFTGITVGAEKIIVSMGRLQKKKGFDILIDAFAKVLDYYPDSKLFIAGGDEGEEQNLLHQINRLGLKNKAFLVGAISGQDKIDFLANADLFVLPSYNENFGNVYIESLAAGTPIVASRNTPWSEVEDANCGRWVANSIEETQNAILDMLKRDRDQMRNNAKQYALKFDWKNIAKEFSTLFQTMIKEKHDSK